MTVATEKNKRGKERAIVRRDANGKKVGSSTARRNLNNAINHNNTVTVNDNPNGKSRVTLDANGNYTNEIGLDSFEINSYQGSPVTHHSMSTYTAFDNNPIFWADPSGADAEQDAWVAQNEAEFAEFNNAHAPSWSGGVGNCCGNAGTLPIPFLLNPAAHIAFTKSFFPKDGTANDLIDYYVAGSEKKYLLNQKQMLDIYPTVDQDGNPINLSLNIADMLKVGELSPGESKPFEDHISVYAGTAGTLGNFTVTRTGTITLNEKTGAREFNGSFIFKDDFDFNPADRPWQAELQVWYARNFLPGKKFKVYGKMSVRRQKSFKKTN